MRDATTSTNATEQISRDVIERSLDQVEGYLALRMPKHAMEILDRRILGRYISPHFRVSLNYGQVLRQMGQYREALKHLEAAALVDAENVGLALARGWCYKRTHRLAQAIDALETAKKAWPIAVSVRYNLACYWALASNPRRALEELKVALSLSPRLRFRAWNDPDFAGLRTHPEFIRLTTLPAALP